MKNLSRSPVQIRTNRKNKWRSRPQHKSGIYVSACNINEPNQVPQTKRNSPKITARMDGAHRMCSRKVAQEEPRKLKKRQNRQLSAQTENSEDILRPPQVHLWPLSTKFTTKITPYTWRSGRKAKRPRPCFKFWKRSRSREVTLFGRS